MKLREVGLRFKGPLPSGTIDESRIPVLGHKLPLMVDSLQNDEEVNGLVLDYGKYLSTLA